MEIWWPYLSIADMMNCLFVSTKCRDKIGSNLYYCSFVCKMQYYAPLPFPSFLNRQEYNTSFGTKGLDRVRFKYWSTEMYNRLFQNVIFTWSYEPRLIQACKKNPVLFYSIGWKQLQDWYRYSCLGNVTTNIYYIKEPLRYFESHVQTEFLRMEHVQEYMQEVKELYFSSCTVGEHLVPKLCFQAKDNVIILQDFRMQYCCN